MTRDRAHVPDGVPTDLLDRAASAHTHAYCPYSGYAVGAAIRTATGSVFTGCNVENASYPLGTCAEAGAIAAMVSAGEHAIAEIVVVTNGTVPGTPCGGCRQRIREFAGPDVQVHSVAVDSDGDRIVAVTLSVADALPASFGPDHLNT